MRTRMTVLIAFLLVMALAATASAGTQSRSRTDGYAASTYWTQVDGPPAADSSTQPFGNVHVGWLDAWESGKGLADVFVYIDDFRCPKGKLPGGHEFDHEPPADACKHLGTRFGEGYGLAFTVNRKLTTANLKGKIKVTAGGHGEPGGEVARPRADITWHGVGPTWRSVNTYRTQGGGSSYFDRFRSVERNATMAGTLGPMGFDPKLSGGSVSRYRSMYLERSK